MNTLLALVVLCLAAVNSTKIEKCIRQNGGYSDWLKWSPCSVSCGKGTRSRHRYCDNPIPMYGGDKCQGDDKETEECDMGPCPEKATLGEYEDIGKCSKPCGGGVQKRQRKCLPPINPYYKKCYVDCPKDRDEITEPCNTHKCKQEVGNECQGCKRQANYDAARNGKPEFVGHACRTSNKFCEGRTKGIKAMYAQNDWFFLHCAPDGSWCKPCATRGLVYNPECGNCEVKRSGVKCTDAGTWDKTRAQKDVLNDEELW
ncbi:thrombospondin-2-like [Clytia hemisphaerica]|uniref:Uncharacterized protein n=1 Tax=Clytia hemisphaerica TaxID=252671 RepID=A0A7M5XG61_9CNID